jgi:hypothetical protein
VGGSDWVVEGWVARVGELSIPVSVGMDGDCEGSIYCQISKMKSGSR